MLAQQLDYVELQGLDGYLYYAMWTVRRLHSHDTRQAFVSSRGLKGCVVVTVQRFTSNLAWFLVAVVGKVELDTCKLLQPGLIQRLTACTSNFMTTSRFLLLLVVCLDSQHLGDLCHDVECCQLRAQV